MVTINLLQALSFRHEVSEGTEVKKRKDYIEWTEYFMATAFLAAKRSKDPSYQVGACIVNKDKKIVGVGFVFILYLFFFYLYSFHTFTNLTDIAYFGNRVNGPVHSQWGLYV